MNRKQLFNEVQKFTAKIALECDGLDILQNDINSSLIRALTTWEGRTAHNLSKLCKTTDEYWDCNCMENYIQPKHSESCKECGAIKEAQPSSRINEVLGEL